MRLELIRPETLEPKSSASANSATPAKLGSNESWQARTADPVSYTHLTLPTNREV